MRAIIEYDLLIQTPYHIGTGYGARHIADSLVLTDSRGRLLIHGDTIKGVARDALWDLLGRETDVSKQIFGGREGDRLAGNWVFSHARLSQDLADLLEKCHEKQITAPLSGQFLSRAFNKIDENAGRAREDHLFRLQMGDLSRFGSNFTGTVEYIGEEITSSDLISQAAVIVGALRFVRALGRRRRRGIGRCLFTNFRYHCDVGCATDSLLDSFAKWVGGNAND